MTTTIGASCRGQLPLRRSVSRAPRPFSSPPLLSLAPPPMSSSPPPPPPSSARTEEGTTEEATPAPGSPPAPPLPPPEMPLPGDCCGSGCVRCVWDVYYEELEAYNELVARQRGETNTPD